MAIAAITAITIAFSCTATLPQRTHIGQGVNCTSVSPTGNSWSARATFDPTTALTEGWAQLTVEAAPTPNLDADLVAAYAAGYVEGVATSSLVAMTVANNVAWLSNANFPDILAFSWKSVAWLSANVANPPPGAEDYWQQVAVVLAQFEGLAAGVQSAQPQITRDLVLSINLFTEMWDILSALNISARPDYANMTPEELRAYVFLHTHCSAIFRVTDDLSEVFASHATWSSYETMLRVFKTITLPVAGAAAATIRYSGYPGTLPSFDDFFVTSQRLVIIETTNSVFDTSLYDVIVPESVPYWVRVLVATRMATTAESWHSYFYYQQSGTYNNQWMTFDYKLFTPRQPLPAGAFFVSEQLPGYFEMADQTAILQFGVWPSYNVPFYPNIYDLSGYPAVVNKSGTDNSYQLAPRAKIFRRDAGAIETLADLKNFMRMNHFGTSDPLATAPDHAIAARGDLMTPPALGGAIDAKITSATMMAANMGVSIIAGPTTLGQPPFAWLGRAGGGMPTSFNYSWISV